MPPGQSPQQTDLIGCAPATAVEHDGQVVTSRGSVDDRRVQRADAALQPGFEVLATIVRWGAKVV
jgi:hypothetical protein